MRHLIMIAGALIAGLATAAAETQTFKFVDMRDKNLCMPIAAMQFVLADTGYEYENQHEDVLMFQHPNDNVAFLQVRYNEETGAELCLLGAGYRDRKV